MLNPPLFEFIPPPLPPLLSSVTLCFVGIMLNPTFREYPPLLSGVTLIVVVFLGGSPTKSTGITNSKNLRDRDFLPVWANQVVDGRGSMGNIQQLAAGYIPPAEE